MKVVDSDTFPKIKITTDAFDTFTRYAKNGEKRFLILCDSYADAETIVLYNPFLVKQSCSYVKNKATFEEINKYIGVKKDKDYGEIQCSTIVRTEISSKLEDFKEEDFKYFSSLTDVDDWIIIGEVGKDCKMFLYFFDMEHRIAACYTSDGKDIDDVKADFAFEIINEYACSDEQIKDDIKKNCIDSVYFSSVSPSGSIHSNVVTSTPPAVYEKSELNKKDPDIQNIV